MHKNEHAVLLAALTLKIKYQTKILRSKEYNLSHEQITKNLDMCVPQ